MKIISAGRGQGKTAKLVEMSSKEWKHIVCKDRQGVDVIIKTAERLGLDIPYPITIRELLKGGLSMSNSFHVNPKEEILNQMREELRERAKRELFLMEFDEVKRAVKYFKVTRKNRIGGTSNYSDLAINALERQIPQKPREHYHWGDFTKEEKLENNQWFCGKCDWQIGEEDNYCNECGQRVDWS